MIRLKNVLLFSVCATLAGLTILMLAACSAPTPAPIVASPLPPDVAPPPTSEPPAQPTATQVVAPTATPVTPATAAVTPPATATATVTPTATRGRVFVRPTATSAGKLSFTVDFAPSAPRPGDNKIQLTVSVHAYGGAPPYQVLEDGTPQAVTQIAENIFAYVRDWHNCGPDEPHTITLVSADGQQVSEALMFPYKCAP